MLIAVIIKTECLKNYIIIWFYEIQSIKPSTDFKLTSNMMKHVITFNGNGNTNHREKISPR